MNKNLLLILNQLNIHSFDFEKSLCIYILKKYNPRISEILDATRENFYPGKFLILQGKKRSRNVVIRDDLILILVDHLLQDGRKKIFENINYKMIYREILRSYTFQIQNIKIKKNKKVTHLFRYLNVDKIENLKYIRDVLQHGSIKSSMYYINKIKEPNHGKT